MTNPSAAPAEIPLVLDVHKAALQEIDRIVGNEPTLGESETARLRGVLAAALSEAHLRRSPAVPRIYRKASSRNGLLYQHTCGRVRAFNRPPASGECRVGHIRCDYESADGGSWQPLYCAEEIP